ncbi:MAG: NAD+ synthase [Acidobacteria bacterium]|nr:NAD+ synthase [Acidobacteriota bacterium]
MKTNCAFIEKILVSFIKTEIHRFGFRNAILGLSGGLDSAVTACLSARALGEKNVWALRMPYGKGFRQDVDDALEVAKEMGIHTQVIDIKPMVDAFYETHPTDNRLLKGNKMARERMSILYDFSVRKKALIIGTSNKTELLLGYGTLHGDMASALNPIGDLYKTQIREFAAHLGIPGKIIQKAPAAGLWPGQTDEGELGMTYEVIDRVLHALVDERRSPEDLIQSGFDKETVRRIETLIKKSEFKRKLPPIAKISNRTVGHDFLYSSDRGK